MHLFPDPIKYKPLPTLPKPLPNSNFSKIWERKTGKKADNTPINQRIHPKMGVFSKKKHYIVQRTKNTQNGCIFFIFRLFLPDSPKLKKHLGEKLCSAQKQKT
jgi:hypothetical protein